MSGDNIQVAYLDENNIVVKAIIVKPSDVDPDAKECPRVVSNGWEWDTDKNLFYPESQYASWTKSSDANEDGVGYWVPPTPMPEDGSFYVWDEDTTSWVAV